MPSLADIVSNAASKYGIPTAILDNLVMVESGGNPNAQGRAGEIGLTQLMPSTAAALGITTAAQAYDPATNVNGGAAYLRALYEKYGSWTAALSAYNSGSPSSSAGGAYAAKVMQGIDPAAITTSSVAPASAGAFDAPGPSAGASATTGGSSTTGTNSTAGFLPQSSDFTDTPPPGTDDGMSGQNSAPSSWLAAIFGEHSASSIAGVMIVAVLVLIGISGLIFKSSG